MLALDTFEFSTDGGTTWVAFVEAKASPVPEVEVDYQEVTNQDSNGWREWIAGLKDGGSVDVQSNYTRAGYTQLAAIDDTLVSFRVTFDNGDKFTYSGLPRTTPEKSDYGQPKTMITKIKVSGGVSFEAGA